MGYNLFCSGGRTVRYPLFIETRVSGKSRLQADTRRSVSSDPKGLVVQRRKFLGTDPELTGFESNRDELLAISPLETKRIC